MSSQKKQAETESAESDAAALVGTVIAGKYRIDSLLGQGGMGAVYLVQHTGIRKRLAMKLLRASLMRVPAVVARFEREAMAAAHMEHPNVAAASDFGRTEDGSFYLVLEYVEGVELRAAMDKAGGPMAPSRVFFIVRQILSALSRSHELGIVHRDLKPENIMLVKRDGYDDFVKVLDFGLALVSRHLSDDKSEEPALPTAPKITQVGDIFGTPAYMAPEQAVGDKVDIRTDLYSIGVLLYEMLTGVRPFSGKSSVVLIQSHLALPPPPMRERAPSAKVPADMEAVVMRLLAKQPADRFQTPDELTAAIEELCVKHGFNWPMPVGSMSSSPVVAPVRKSKPPPSEPRLPTVQRLQTVQHTVAALRAQLAPMVEKVRTRLWPRQTRWTRLRKSLSQLQGRLQGRLPKPLRKLQPWVFAVPVLLIVAGSISAVWLLSSKKASEVPFAAKPAALRPPPQPDELAPQPALDTATAQGRDALETLASRFPKDPRILRQLLRTYSGQRLHADAMRTIAKLAALDAELSRDVEIPKYIVAALQADAESMESAVTLMEQDLGSTGVDLLYDLTTKQTQARWKARLNQSLSKPDVLGKATPGTRLAYELRSAKTCEAKRALLPRAQHDGDQRVLTQLRSLSQTQGCGFLDTADCWPCLRKDHALQDAIAAVEARPK